MACHRIKDFPSRPSAHPCFFGGGGSEKPRDILSNLRKKERPRCSRTFKRIKASERQPRRHTNNPSPPPRRKEWRWNVSNDYTDSAALDGSAPHNSSDTDASAPKNPPPLASDSQSPASASAWPSAAAGRATASKAPVAGMVSLAASVAASWNLRSAVAVVGTLAAAAAAGPAVPRH